MSTPSPVNPYTTAGLQETTNLVSQKLANTNQNTPTGSLGYTYDPTTGQFTSSTQYSPTQQALLNLFQGTQNLAGTQAPGYLTAGANQLNPAASTSASASNPNNFVNPALGLAQTGTNLINTANYGAGAPNIGNMASGGTADQLAAWNAQQQPFLTYQQNALDTKLKTQGLVPGDEAYDIQMRNLNNTQTTAQAAADAQFEPQAFSQALTQATLPETLGSALIGSGNSVLGGQSTLANTANTFGGLGSLFNQEGSSLAALGGPLGVGTINTPGFAGANNNAVAAQGQSTAQQNALFNAYASGLGSLFSGVAGSSSGSSALGSLGGALAGAGSSAFNGLQSLFQGLNLGGATGAIGMLA